MRTSTFAIAGLLTLCGFCGESLAADGAQVVVELTDGRTLSVEVDARTTEAQLWVVRRGGEAKLVGAIAAHRVSSLTCAGRRVSLSQLVAQLPQVLAAQELGRSQERTAVAPEHAGLTHAEVADLALQAPAGR